MAGLKKGYYSLPFKYKEGKKNSSKGVFFYTAKLGDWPIKRNDQKVGVQLKMIKERL